MIPLQLRGGSHTTPVNDGYSLGSAHQHANYRTMKAPASMFISGPSAPELNSARGGSKLFPSIRGGGYADSNSYSMESGEELEEEIVNEVNLDSDVVEEEWKEEEDAEESVNNSQAGVEDGIQEEQTVDYASRKERIAAYRAFLDA